MTEIRLGTDPGCDLSCAGLALKEFETLAKPYYSRNVSIRPLTTQDYLAPFQDLRTARKRVLRAERLGYEAVVGIEPSVWFEDMLEINRSLPERQGRPMDDSYVNLRRPTGMMPKVLCLRHNAIVYGVMAYRHLVGYASIYRCGDLVHVSQFLGHGDHLDNGIMYLLIDRIIRAQAPTHAPSTLFYNRHDSGTDGLRFFKERCGLKPQDVTWIA